MNNLEDFENIGGREYFEKGLCIIEWGEQIRQVLPKETIYIYFEKDLINENIRKITVKGANL